MPAARKRPGTAADGWGAREQLAIRRWLSKIAADLQQNG